MCDEQGSVMMVGVQLGPGTGNTGGGFALFSWLQTARLSHQFLALFLWALLVLSPEFSESSPFLSELN